MIRPRGATPCGDDLAARLGVVASAAAMVEAIRAAAPEVSDDTDDDDDTLGRVLPERARAAEAVADALSVEPDYVVAALMLADARERFQAMDDALNSRSGDRLAVIAHARAQARYQRWSDVHRLMAAAVAAEQREAARARADRREVSS